MIAVRVIIAEDAVYTGRLPIAAKCMSHHVVPTARDARVVESVLQQDFLSRGPGKAAVTVPGEITIQQFIGLFEVNARETLPGIALAGKEQVLLWQPDYRIK